MGVDVFEIAHKVSIVETIGQYIKLEPRNGKFYGLCPFHNDKRIGSFVVFPDISSEKRGWFQCYACGEKGDNIDFVKNYLGINYREAAVTISVNAGLITRDDAEVLLGRAMGTVQIQERKVKQLEKKVVLAKKQDPDHMNRVYNCFALASDSLSQETKEILLEKRKIPQSSLPKYFQFPDISRLKVFWPKFRKEMSREFGISKQADIDQMLLGVPGFYINSKNVLSFSTCSESRIGIKVFDRNGKISGIQTRAIDTADGEVRTKVEKEDRYKFLSSGFANGTKDSRGSMGCSCGYVEDVLYPLRKGRETVVAITEGRFKAEILAPSEYKVVNMHSISNWEPAGKAAREVAGVIGASRFILCYDCEQNDNVFSSASSLYEKLSPVLPTDFAVWDPAYGKGIDDVVIAGHIKEISRISAEEYFPKKAG